MAARTLAAAVVTLAVICGASCSAPDPRGSGSGASPPSGAPPPRSTGESTSAPADSTPSLPQGNSARRPWRLTADAGVRLAELAARADRCLASGSWNVECVCPPEYARGCHADPDFVAYDHPGLPIQGPERPVDSQMETGRGLAYVLGGARPKPSQYEFNLNGYTVVLEDRAGLDAHWYWTHICRTCD